MCQEVVERKEEVLNLKAQIAIYAFFEDTCNQKTAKICQILVKSSAGLSLATVFRYTIGTLSFDL